MCPSPVISAPETLSEARLEANRNNSRHSTGPRTPEGKQRARLNGLRHGLTGQTVVMPFEDRKVYERHVHRLLESLNPQTPAERDLAEAIANDQWRLNRARAIEENIFALGQTTNPIEIEDADHRTNAALTQAQTFLDDAKQLSLLTLYESRINRTLQRNLDELRRLQDARKADHARQLEEAILLAQLAAAEGKTYDPKPDGFAFSAAEIARQADRRRRLEQARELSRTARPQPETATRKAA